MLEDKAFCPISINVFKLLLFETLKINKSTIVNNNKDNKCP